MAAAAPLPNGDIALNFVIAAEKTREVAVLRTHAHNSFRCMGAWNGPLVVWKGIEEMIGGLKTGCWHSNQLSCSFEVINQTKVVVLISEIPDEKSEIVHTQNIWNLTFKDSKVKKVWVQSRCWKGEAINRQANIEQTIRAPLLTREISRLSSECDQKCAKEAALSFIENYFDPKDHPFSKGIDRSFFCTTTYSSMKVDNKKNNSKAFTLDNVDQLKGSLSLFQWKRNVENLVIEQSSISNYKATVFLQPEPGKPLYLKLEHNFIFNFSRTAKITSAQIDIEMTGKFVKCQNPILNPQTTPNPRPISQPHQTENPKINKSAKRCSNQAAPMTEIEMMLQQAKQAVKMLNAIQKSSNRQKRTSATPSAEQRHKQPAHMSEEEEEEEEYDYTHHP